MYSATAKIACKRRIESFAGELRTNLQNCFAKRRNRNVVQMRWQICSTWRWRTPAVPFGLNGRAMVTLEVGKRRQNEQLSSQQTSGVCLFLQDICIRPCFEHLRFQNCFKPFFMPKTQNSKVGPLKILKSLLSERLLKY